MIRLSRALYTAYGALLVWLAYCAVQSARNGAPWHTAVFVVASGVAITAAIREGELDDALRREAVRAERAARPDPRERVIADQIALGWSDINSACCLTWWETRGLAHDPVSCSRMDNAA
jgi:hypothetical protein